MTSNNRCRATNRTQNTHIKRKKIKASPSKVEQLLESFFSFKVRESNLDKLCDCSICSAGFKIKEMAVRAPCGHVFHKKCLKKWLLIKKCCPLCNYNFESDSSLDSSLQKSSA